MIYIDQIAELAAESIKAASLTPLQADESAPLSRREAVRDENARRANISPLTDHRAGDIRQGGSEPFAGNVLIQNHYHERD
jgi:hypothetical protein